MSDFPWLGDAILRRGRPSDVEAMLSLKERLAITREDDGDEGGFLLGSSAEVYTQLCHARRVTLLEIGGELAGLATSLDDAMFRASDVWARKDRVAWQDFSPAEVEADRVAYFDQLAVSPDFQSRYFGAMLALWTIEALFLEGHDHVLATTIVEPVVNSAALPLMEKVGARRIGRIEEDYHGVGRVTSVIHYIERARCHDALAALASGGTDLERATIARVREQQAQHD